MRKPGEITVLFIDADTLFRRAALCSLHFSGFIHISAEDSLALFLSVLAHGVQKYPVCLREAQENTHRSL